MKLEEFEKFAVTNGFTDRLYPNDAQVVNANNPYHKTAFYRTAGFLRADKIKQKQKSWWKKTYHTQATFLREKNNRTEILDYFNNSNISYAKLPQDPKYEGRIPIPSDSTEFRKVEYNSLDNLVLSLRDLRFANKGESPFEVKIADLLSTIMGSAGMVGTYAAIVKENSELLVYGVGLLISAATLQALKKTVCASKSLFGKFHWSRHCL